MHTVKPIIIVCIMLTLGISCKTLAFRSYAKHLSISYGSGGGFSGAINEYILKGNGDLFEFKSLSNDTSYVKKISSKDIKRIFKMAEAKTLASIKQYEAGNMSNFIRIYKDGNLIHNFQWPSGKLDLPKEIKELDNLLNQLQLK